MKKVVGLILILASIAHAATYSLGGTIGQPCVGAATSPHYSFDTGFWSTIGSPPVPGTNSLQSSIDQSTAIDVDDLLAGATDADGDALDIIAVSATSSFGGRVTLSDGLIIYNAPDGFIGTDSFTYVMADAGGDTVVGTVTITVQPSSGGATIVSASFASGPNTFTIRFSGTPGILYRIQVSSDLKTWHTLEGSDVLVPDTDDQQGIGTFVEAIPSDSSRFYRVIRVE